MRDVRPARHWYSLIGTKGFFALHVRQCNERQTQVDDNACATVDIHACMHELCMELHPGACCFADYRIDLASGMHVLQGYRRHFNLLWIKKLRATGISPSLPWLCNFICLSLQYVSIHMCTQWRMQLAWTDTDHYASELLRAIRWLHHLHACFFLTLLRKPRNPLSTPQPSQPNLPIIMSSGGGLGGINWSTSST